jgi:hypothetical protein
MRLAPVERKTEIGPLNGTPEKRMFWSIISDYDLKTGLTELIDNALDVWFHGDRRRELRVEVHLDPDLQVVTLTDTAGGVDRESLPLLITPGGSNNSPDAETIGFFGVGSKRAVVALAERVTIKTRHPDDQSYQIDIANEWLESPSWELPAYVIPDITPGTTEIELSHLRRKLDKLDEADLAKHFAEVYAFYLENCDCEIFVNGTCVDPIYFTNWSYPPNYPPQRIPFDFKPDGKSTLNVEIQAGLISDRDPKGENYGVYFYCNDRLIVKELRVREVGYGVPTEAGTPHPDASLCRAVVRFNGPAKLMPWNSSKTGINYNHPAFLAIKKSLIQLVTHFTKLSRAFKADWPGAVFAYESGDVSTVVAEDDGSPVPKLRLPPTPRVNKTHADKIKAANSKVIERQPWTLGLLEALAAVDLVIRSRLETKNRIALILIDSTIEIAFKEYLVKNLDLLQGETLKGLLEDRTRAIAKIRTRIGFNDELIERITHYYTARNRLVHERATVEGVTDRDIEIYRQDAWTVLDRLFCVIQE